VALLYLPENRTSSGAVVSVAIPALTVYPYPVRMTTHPHTQTLMTPEERRMRLRAFADRMLICAENMAPPEDLRDLERTVRVVALIERLYARVHVTEVKAPALAAEHLMNRLKLQDDKHHVRSRLKFSPHLKPTPTPPPATGLNAPFADEVLCDPELLELHAHLMPAVPFPAQSLRAPSFQTSENPLRQTDKPEKRALSGLPPSCQPQPPPRISP